MERLDSLAAAIQDDHELILTDWKRRVRELPKARHLDTLALEDNFRSLLDEISNSLLVCHDTGSLPPPLTAIEHGRQRSDVGFDLHQVVIEYNMLRHVLRDCADRHHISLDGYAGSVLHRIIDESLAAAVVTHSAQESARFQARLRERMADVVHDIKSPLSAIQTAAHILEMRLPAESKQAVSTMLGIVQRNCQTLNAMLAKLLEGSSGQTADMNQADVDLRLLVGDVIQRLTPLAQKIQVPILNEVPASVNATADPFLLKQAIQNLLSNALLYTTDGQITVGAAATDRRVDIWVRDTGSGIAPDRLEGLFTKGAADPLRSDSSGRGLSIVKRIVDAHNGEVAVESTPGKGSVFTISLPR